ncbi:glycosyltransferase [Streptomyces sp. NPDC052040]|uniref:glycosyltransferase family protein n=1 Tax=unclassified Streptomyces TaxID=2593676 RepID=UPI0037D4697A
MNILLWPVRGSWTAAFAQGTHTCLVPVPPNRDAAGPGRPRAGSWPESVREVDPEELRDAEVDLVLLQRPHEPQLAERLLGGRRIGRDLPGIYLEHHTPDGDVPRTRHPFADRSDLTLVHAAHFNRLFWDSGSTRTEVIEPGIADPGHQYTGRLARACVVMDEPVRGARPLGTDLLPALAEAAPLDVYGRGTEGLAARLGLPEERCRSAELPQAELHRAMAERRFHLHPVRWASPGLPLLEAMHLGLPVVALATTEVVEAVPRGAGALSTRPEVLARAARHYLHEPEAAAADGARARQAALGRYGLKRFLADWNRVMAEALS